MRHHLILAVLFVAACSRSEPLPEHSVEIEQLSPGSYRVEVTALTEITADQCEALIAEFRAQAGEAGQVSVYKPSEKMEGRLLPWCVDNFDGAGIRFNTELFS